MKLTCVLATRGRPGPLTLTVSQTLNNMRLPDTRLMVSADADDQGTVDILKMLAIDPRIIVSIREREDDLGSKYNRALTETPADVYLHMVDYAPVVTEGFDIKLLEAAARWPDNIGVVNTHLANLSFPAAQGITHGLASRLGYIYPPYFPYWFVDHWLDDIAKLIGRVGFADVVVDCSRRPGTQEMREPAWWGTFFDVMAPMRSKLAADIIRSPGFDALPWQKEQLIAAAPLVEQRSKIINNIVRQMGTGGPAPDDRYLRIKGRAIDMLRAVIADEERLAA